MKLEGQRKTNTHIFSPAKSSFWSIHQHTNAPKQADVWNQAVNCITTDKKKIKPRTADAKRCTNLIMETSCGHRSTDAAGSIQKNTDLNRNLLLKAQNNLRFHTWCYRYQLPLIWKNRQDRTSDYCLLVFYLQINTNLQAANSKETAFN